MIPAGVFSPLDHSGVGVSKSETFCQFTPAQSCKIHHISWKLCPEQLTWGSLEHICLATQPCPAAPLRPWLRDGAKWAKSAIWAHSASRHAKMELGTKCAPQSAVLGTQTSCSAYPSGIKIFPPKGVCDVIIDGRITTECTHPQKYKPSISFFVLTWWCRQIYLPHLSWKKEGKSWKSFGEKEQESVWLGHKNSSWRHKYSCGGRCQGSVTVDQRNGRKEPLWPSCVFLTQYRTRRR